VSCVGVVCGEKFCYVEKHPEFFQIFLLCGLYGVNNEFYLSMKKLPIFLNVFMSSCCWWAIWVICCGVV
jgi:hypothetical protein